MNPMPLLLALLVVAYIGSLWVSARGSRSFGSPSGAEYVVLGVLLGPRALGILGFEALQAFEPIAHVALGWLALGYGLECGMLGAKRARWHRIVLGTLFAAVTALIAGSCVAFAGLRLGMRWGPDLLMLSAAMGLVSAETTRHAVRWVIDRHIANGPLSDLVAELAAADDAFVLIAMAVLFAFGSGPDIVLGASVPWWASALGTLGMGVLLGGACSWLMARSPRHVEWWALLLGGSWIAIGASTKLGLSSMAATFAMGLTLSMANAHAARLRVMVSHAEGPVLLPALLLAGAHITLPRSQIEIALVGVAVLGRAVASVVNGTLIAAARRSTRGATPWLGLGMLSSGTLTMMVGFALFLGFDTMLGRIALLVSALGTLLGEIIGPFALRRALLRAGELGERETRASSAASGHQEEAAQ